MSPEALARLAQQRRNSTISSLLIAILSIVLIGIIMTIILLKFNIPKPEPIVTYTAPTQEDTEIQEKVVNQQIQRQTSAPSSSMAKVIAAATSSPVSVPVPDVDVPDVSADFGDGSDFGAGFGSGGGQGFAGAQGIPSLMRKRCSKKDRLSRLEQNGGSEKCEEAVVAALRYLKETQNADGSWGNDKHDAMTGLAVLAFLGHCETPQSKEFGSTVLNGITYLTNLGLAQEGKIANNLKDKHWSYNHAIAAYALAESYTFTSAEKTNIPNLKEVVQKAGQYIIDNQHPSGSWDYYYAKGTRPGDTSIAAWNVQALKACKHTGIEFDGLKKAGQKAVEAFSISQSPDGGGAYGVGSKAIRPVRCSDPDDKQINKTHFSSLTGAVVLGQQMFGKGRSDSVRQGLKFIMDNDYFNYHNHNADLYALYYDAQAVINKGGDIWTDFNDRFMNELLENQSSTGAFPPMGTKGTCLNTGNAAFAGGNGNWQEIYRTCLATLTLEVYYRFLPGTGKNSTR